jgi:CheY-like chemotaxis protein
VGRQTLRELNGSDVLRYASNPIPLRSLPQAIGMATSDEETAALVLDLGGRLFAAKVPAVLGEHELVRRPAEPLLATTGIGASALMEDGRLALLLDLAFVERCLARARADAAPAPKGEVVVAKQRHVLIVDDSPVVTEMISELLTTSGLSVQVATDGVAALAAIEQRTPDLVLSDVDMPRMDGITLLKEIRQRTQTLPVVMLTTRGSVEDRQRASSLGANAYVLKSGFQSDVLLDVVSRFLSVKP